MTKIDHSEDFWKKIDFEGGVAVGAAVIDSPYLFEMLWSDLILPGPISDL